MTESWIDIPNLETVDLPFSFGYVQSKLITSILITVNEWIDVSPILADLVNIRESDSDDSDNSDNSDDSDDSDYSILSDATILYYLMHWFYYSDITILFLLVCFWCLCYTTFYTTYSHTTNFDQSEPFQMT